MPPHPSLIISSAPALMDFINRPMAMNLSRAFDNFMPYAWQTIEEFTRGMSAGIFPDTDHNDTMKLTNATMPA